jgi:hypothetical protein
LGNVKTMRNRTGASIGPVARLASSAAAFTSCRHGRSRFDDSTMTPLPT